MALFALAVAAAAPLAAAVANDVDCGFRQLALEVAARNLDGDATKLSIVADGLNISDCPAASWIPAAAPVQHSVDAPGIELFVAPNGSDANDGSVSSPFLSLHIAILVLLSERAARKVPRACPYSHVTTPHPTSNPYADCIDIAYLQLFETHYRSA